MITAEEILMGRDKEYPLTEELKHNLYNLLLPSVNQFRTLYGKPLIVSSGYRPKEINQNVPNASPNSWHQFCLAVDFKDRDGKIDQYCLDNLHTLEQAHLYLEHPESTIGWCHLQYKAPKSGNRVFKVK
jgi:uncharacterized protein YcbK (DUF882 family)